MKTKKKKKPSVAKLASKNAAIFMENGPGLRFDYSTFVVARDRKRKKVLIGGLGGMGCGTMWGGEYHDDKGRPGFEDAPECFCEEGYEPVVTFSADILAVTLRKGAYVATVSDKQIEGSLMWTKKKVALPVAAALRGSPQTVEMPSGTTIWRKSTKSGKMWCL